MKVNHSYRLNQNERDRPQERPSLLEAGASIEDLEAAFVNQLQNEELRARRTLRVLEHQQEQLGRLREINNEVSHHHQQHRHHPSLDDDQESLVDLLNQDIEHTSPEPSSSYSSFASIQSVKSQKIDSATTVVTTTTEGGGSLSVESLKTHLGNSTTTDSTHSSKKISLRLTPARFGDHQQRVIADKKNIQREMNYTKEVLLKSQRKLYSLEKSVTNLQNRALSSREIGLLLKEISKWKLVIDNAVLAIQEEVKGNEKFWETSMRFFSPSETMFFLTAKQEAIIDNR